MRILRYMLVLALSTHSLSASLLDSPQLRIANTTQTKAYLCFYYHHGTTLSRASKPFFLPKNNAVIVTPPPPAFGSQRIIAASRTYAFPQKCSQTQHSFMAPPCTIGMQSSYDLSLSYNGTHYHLQDTEKWMVECAREKAYTTYTHAFDHADTVSTLQKATCEPEESFLTQRSQRTQAALTSLLGKAPKRPLRVGIAASGGGIRAMTTTMGLLTALDEIGVLDTVETMSVLSGSSWAVAPWILSGKTTREYSSYISTKLAKGITPDLNAICDDFETVKKNKALCSLPISSIDFYGLCLSHTFIKPLVSDHMKTHLSTLQSHLLPKTHPLPLFTSVARFTHEPYHWFTSTPFKLFSHKNQVWIPHWGLGRTYLNGSSTNTTPEPTLGYMLGIFGSSFSLSFRDVVERAHEYLGSWATSWMGESLRSTISQANWANKKVSPSTLPNILQGHNDISHKTLHLVDGGYKNNVPLEPLLKESNHPFDLVIVLDSRRNAAQRVAGYREAEKSLAQSGVTLPHFSDEQLSHNTCCMAHGSPSVIYFTLEQDPLQESTFAPCNERVYATPNFAYSSEEYERLSHFMYSAVTHRSEKIIDALRTLAT